MTYKASPARLIRSSVCPPCWSATVQHCLTVRRPSSTDTRLHSFRDHRIQWRPRSKTLYPARYRSRCEPRTHHTLDGFLCLLTTLEILWSVERTGLIEVTIVLTVPLQNWPMYRKAAQYTTLTFTAFIMSSALSANQLAFNTMAKQFHKTPVQLSWTSSTAIGGQIAAPFVYPALFAVFGRSCVLFWSVLALLLCQVWSALLRTNFTSLILSRLLAGLVTSVPQVIGASFIMEAFFLHQRGKLYAIFELAFQFSISFGPMMGGFILNNHSLSWPWVFWWTCPLLGFCAILVVLFVHETNFDRTSLTSTQPWNESWLMNRVVTFLPGWKVVPKIDGHKLVSQSLPLRSELSSNMH